MSSMPIDRVPDDSGTLREQDRPVGQADDRAEAVIPAQVSGSRRGTWGFQPSDDGWLENLKAYKAFCADSGRRPRARGEDPAERRLARWISSQRQDYRALILPAARKSQLDAQIPGWAD